MKISLFLVLLVLVLLDGTTSKAVFISDSQSRLNEHDVMQLVRNPKELSVTKEGDVTHQHVDDKQGQLTDQFVGPDGIRNTVHRKGQLVLDQIVASNGTVKQLVPQI